MATDVMDTCICSTCRVYLAMCRRYQHFCSCAFSVTQWWVWVSLW